MPTISHQVECQGAGHGELTGDLFDACLVAVEIHLVDVNRLLGHGGIGPETDGERIPEESIF